MFMCLGSLCRGRCHKWFHAKCERLDYSAGELQTIAARNKYVCKACEEARLRDAGFDLTKGRFEWQCRFCSKTFADEAEATVCGKRCAGSEARRQWSCPCNGDKSGSGASRDMTQCGGCNAWFHKSCKRRARAEWEVATAVDTLCLGCEKVDGAHAKASGRASALGSDDAADGGGEESSQAARARRRKLNTAQQNEALAELLPVGEEEVGGTVENGRVFVKESTLGRGSGFGLFAGQNFANGEHISSYEGPIIHRSEVEEATSMDTSYVLRIPNSGGALIDGKPFGDAIRANAQYPGAWGRYYPVEGAPEWRQGAASMANDPRDHRLYNSRLQFVKRQGAKALAELAPMRALLYATRDIKIGEEIFYNYGSDKPFEKMRKEMLRKQVELQKREREVCRSVWVPYADGEQPRAPPPATRASPEGPAVTMKKKIEAKKADAAAKAQAALQAEATKMDAAAPAEAPAGAPGATPAEAPATAPAVEAAVAEANEPATEPPSTAELPPLPAANNVMTKPVADALPPSAAEPPAA